MKLPWLLFSSLILSIISKDSFWSASGLFSSSASSSNEETDSSEGGDDEVSDEDSDENFIDELIKEGDTDNKGYMTKQDLINCFIK